MVKVQRFVAQGDKRGNVAIILIAVTPAIDEFVKPGQILHGLN